MTTIDANLTALRARYSQLADRLDRYSGKSQVCVFQARDGGIGYGLKTDAGIKPVTDPASPLARIQRQLTKHSNALQDFTKPVLIVGLYPGNELIYIFNLSEQCDYLHARQDLFICIDSLACLYGFLLAFDARKLIESDRARFFWHEDAGTVVAQMRQKPESPYIFTLITGASSRVLDEVMPHFAMFNRERGTATNRLLKENNDYYDGITDTQLAAAIAGSDPSRAPRLLTLTSPWTTVVQYSARDICSAFRSIGWEVRHINIDSALTPFYFASQINEFKPDIFLFINHLRTEAARAYPDNMMFLTWIQDCNPLVNRSDTARTWNEMAVAPDPATGKPRKRDLIVGYTSQLKKYGYLEDRLLPVSMIVDNETFKPRRPGREQRSKYECDVCFASNKGRPIEASIRRSIAPALAGHHCDEKLLFAIHDHLWQCYRAEMSFTDYLELEQELLHLDEFRRVYCALSEDDRDQVIQILFWRINDAIYRHVVLEWCAELGAKLHLYGNSWDRHPEFAKFAMGTLKHEEELSIAYQCAGHCLHLNSMEGEHQRLLEITASGGRPLTRCKDKSKLIPVKFAGALRRIASNRSLTDSEQEAWNEWLFRTASAELNRRTDSTPEELDRFIQNAVHGRMSGSPDWIFPDWPDMNFQNKSELSAILRGRGHGES